MENFPGGFTILMSVYKGDNAYLFEKSLSSIFQNTLTPDNIVLVIDGEITGELNKVILKFEHEEILFIHRLKINSGLAYALNEGMKFVKTQWIVRADSDDINLKHRFESMANYANRYKNLDVIGSNIIECEPEGGLICSRTVPYTHQSISKYIKFRSPMNHMTVCYKKDIVLSVGGYPNLYLKEDYGLWALLINRGYLFGNLNQVLVHATTGHSMYKRRSGFKYIVSELQLQYFLCKQRINGPLIAIALFFLRSSIFLLPNTIRKLFYLKVLRKSL